MQDFGCEMQCPISRQNDVELVDFGLARHSERRSKVSSDARSQSFTSLSCYK